MCVCVRAVKHTEAQIINNTTSRTSSGRARDALLFQPLARASDILNIGAVPAAVYSAANCQYTRTKHNVIIYCCLKCEINNVDLIK